MATASGTVAAASGCLDAALAALEAGLSVIPVGRDKRPRLRWQRFQQELATPDEAEGWFRRWPDAQLALVTGRLSGVDVVDFDRADAAWPPDHHELPTDVVVRTGGGGLHYYVRHCEGVRNSAGALAEGVDVRGEGGYVLLPPSVSEKGPYRFELGGVAAIAELAAGPPAEAWLTDDLLRACGAAADPRHAKVDLDAEAIPQGRRNRTLYHIGAKIWRSGADPDAVREHLEKVNAARCQPPVSAAEVAEVAANVVRYVKRRPRLDVALDKFPCTDSGNAELMAHLYGAELRFDHTSGAWLRWAEHWWRTDRVGLASQMAKEAARVRRHEAARMRQFESAASQSHDASDAHATWARRSESDGAIEATLRRLATERGIATVHSDWDRADALVGVANGVLDLREGRLGPPKPRQHIRLHLDAPFVEDAECPRWERFLTELFGRHDGLTPFLQRLVGYSLAGEPREQVWVLLHGRGANGKSVFLRVLAEVFGDYGIVLPFTCFEARRGDSIPNDLAMLPGRRLAVASEPSDGARFDAARLKALTGGDLVTARFLRREYFQFRPRCVVWLAANRRPSVSDGSEGFWRRCLVVPFTRQFLGRDADPDLAEALLAERPGILRWMLGGLWAYRSTGLRVPACVRDAVADYRTDSDAVARFVADCCETGPDLTATAADLYAAYRTWASAEGIPDNRLLTQAGFGRRLNQRLEQSRLPAPGRPRGFVGIGLASHHGDPGLPG